MKGIRILDFPVRSKCGIDRRCLLYFLDGSQIWCDSPAHLPDHDWCLQSQGDEDNQRRLGAKGICPTYNNPHIMASWVVQVRLGKSKITSVVTSSLKTKSWFSFVQIHFLNLVIVNAYIWYTKAFPGRDLSHYKFREKLVDILVSLKVNEQLKETEEIFEKSISKQKWSRSKFARLGLTISSKLANQRTIELRVKIHPIQSSKQARTRN